ncbi:MAG: DUF3995 domain-containing protein [Myxococcota bacterium]
MTTLAALVSAAVLVALAVLHLYWARGGRWPGTDEASLARTVVGVPGADRMPGPLACVAVALALAVAATLPLAAQGLVGVPIPAGGVRVLTWLAAGVFALRGLGGFFEARFRGGPPVEPFHRLNRQLYSPLCLVLAALLVAASVAPDAA